MSGPLTVEETGVCIRRLMTVWRLALFRGDAPSTAVFTEDVPFFGLTVHGESDGSKSERSELLTAVNNAHLLAGSVEASPGRMLPALLKELALTTASEAPFDAFIRLRLSLLLKGLWDPRNTTAAARPAVPSVTYVPRVFGPVVERALAEVRPYPSPR
jgi:hypothetical protein